MPTPAGNVHARDTPETSRAAICSKSQRRGRVNAGSRPGAWRKDAVEQPTSRCEAVVDLLSAHLWPGKCATEYSQGYLRGKVILNEQIFGSLVFCGLAAGDVSKFYR